MVKERTRLTAETRRDAILGAARHEFACRGFRGSGTAAIAARCGCSEPMIYKHFPSKQALFAAVLLDATEAMKARVDEIIAAAPDPIAGMLAVAEHAATDPLIVEVVRLRMLAASLADVPEIREALLTSVGDVRARMAAVVAESQAAGLMRPDLDPDRVAWIWFGYTLAGGYAHALYGDRAIAEFPGVAATLGQMLRPLPGAEEPA
jgi:AcrR family transcriptional regulator